RVELRMQVFIPERSSLWEVGEVDRLQPRERDGVVREVGTQPPPFPDAVERLQRDPAAGDACAQHPQHEERARKALGRAHLLISRQLRFVAATTAALITVHRHSLWATIRVLQCWSRWARYEYAETCRRTLGREWSLARRA